MEDIKKLSDIEASPIQRIETGFKELDWMYGHSYFDETDLRGLPAHTEWGLPVGKISLWSGGTGIGKSRLAIEMAKNMCLLHPTRKILFIQTEAPISDFAGWAKETSLYPNFYCCSESSIDKIVEIIIREVPYMVFIDSVNEIDEFEIGNKRESKRLIKGANGKHGLKAAMDFCGGHLIMLAQVNGDKKESIKGGTSLPHLVDIHIKIGEYESDPGGCLFIAKIGSKHRHGKKGTSTLFIHYDWGIKSGCDSRLDDEQWCITHNIAHMTFRERLEEKHRLEDEVANFGKRCEHKEGFFEMVSRSFMEGYKK